MATLTSRERIGRAIRREPIDRVPILDNYWHTTIRRWRTEGLGEGVEVADALDIDHIVNLSVDTSPQLPTETLEETDEYVICRTHWGSKIKTLKVVNATSEVIEPGMADITDWPKLKKRIAPDPSRFPFDRLEANYVTWREKGWWINAMPWFGFDISHARFTGTENMLVAMLTDPEIVKDMFTHQLDVSLAMLDMAWERGYEFDGIRWPDDMGYKGKQFFSMDIYRGLLKPLHARAIEWAHAKGIPAELHSCGDIRPFIPEFVEIGLDVLNPLEVKAGVDPLAVKAEFGDRLTLHGGINAALWTQPEAVHAEIDRLVPTLKQGGGYIFSSDHSVPDAVPYDTFRTIVEHAKHAGSYE